jgi:hypothetical protein
MANEKETNQPAHPMDRMANWCNHGGWFTLAHNLQNTLPPPFPTPSESPLGLKVFDPFYLLARGCSSIISTILFCNAITLDDSEQAWAACLFLTTTKRWIESVWC